MVDMKVGVSSVFMLIGVDVSLVWWLYVMILW